MTTRRAGTHHTPARPALEDGTGNHAPGPPAPASGSPAETIARLRMHDAGLHPESQAWLFTPTGRWLRPDFLFRAEGLLVEIEGYAWHGSRRAHRDDAIRFTARRCAPHAWWRGR